MTEMKLKGRFAHQQLHLFIVRSRLTVTTLVFAVVIVPGFAAAQTAQDLVGVWSLVSNDTIKPDGSRVPAFGPNPKSQLILTSTGRFSQIIVQADLPKFASGNRRTGTTDENGTVVRGSSVAFGTYAIADGVVTLTVEASTYPNWTGTILSRPIQGFTGDELRWIVPASNSGGRNEVVWRRVQ